MLTPEQIEEEKQYLKKVIEILKSELDIFKGQVKGYSDDIHEQMAYAWDKTNRLSDTEFVYALANIQKRSVYAENANKKAKSYTRMLDNTYFARIDFDDDETGDHLPIYIGISSVTKGTDIFVFDWRAPISSLFYNSEVGRASYEIPSGEKITGNVTLKRQYKISNGELNEVFDTDMQVIDNVLQKILSSPASHKMKNIVTTIQKEQNELIRKNDSDIFVIQGPAGSGKTSIAMHKIAYLLYAEREKINSSNVMILSPNEIFNNYISDVLPGIGEDNVVQSTFNDFARAYIADFKISTKIEDIYEVVYASKENRDNKKFEEIKFIYDPIYISVLDRFIKKNKKEFLGIVDTMNGDTLFTEDEFYRVQKITSKFKESLYLEGKRIIDRLANMMGLRQETVSSARIREFKKESAENLTGMKIRIKDFYKKLYSNKTEFVNFVKDVFKNQNRTCDYDLESIFELTNESIMKDKLEFQDVTPYMYFKSRIIGITPNKTIGYVFIDEAQDYSLMQYEILSMLFKRANLTLLGDINQSIMPFSRHENYTGIINTIKSYKTDACPSEYELSKTYRSTFEINDFAKKVITYKNTYDQIDRHGDDIQIVKQNSFDAGEILNSAITLSKEHNTVAIICKNISEIEKFKDVIDRREDKNKFRIVTKNDNVFVEEKIMVIPSYLSKGLEFDAVIISNASDESYFGDEKNLLYVVLTRALHKLKIYYTGEFTSLFPESIDKYLVK